MTNPAAVEWDPNAEVKCVHVQECGACPLMPHTYADQRNKKQRRLHIALDRYQLAGHEGSPAVHDVLGTDIVKRYRRRAKLVVARGEKGDVSVGLYRRHDNQNVVDIPECQVLSPPLMSLVAKIRELCSDLPDDLACLLAPARGESGVLTGIDARQVTGEPAPDGGGAEEGVLLTLILTAERAAPVDAMREAARALRRRLPEVIGLAVSLRYRARHQPSSEFISLSGVTEARDQLAETYQFVSHSSFLHVHRGQAERLYATLRDLVTKALPCDGEAAPKVLDLYAGTGAIGLSLAKLGYEATLVESYPPAAALALRAAQAQRLPVEVVTGDVASISRLAAAGLKFDLVTANPPRRGLSPAAREAIAGLEPRLIVYVACDLDNLSRDLDHLSRLGYACRELIPIDMLPLTEEVEVMALLERAEPPLPAVLYEDDDILALQKPPYEPILEQAEYPGSLVARAKRAIDGGQWAPVLKVEPGTSGVTIFAKTPEAEKLWGKSVQSGGRLVYLAAARGVTPAKGAITRELKGDGEGRPARTRYRRLAIGGGHSVLRVVPERRYVHQIRRHLAAIGHPVLGDARYGHAPTNRYFEEKHGLDRSFLHLVRVELDHPRTGERLLIEAPLPADLRAALVRASDDSVLRFLENKKALGGQGVRLRDAAASPSSSTMPFSERSPLSTIDPEPESVSPASYASSGVLSQRGARGQPIGLDEAPRTVRGELLTPDDD
ncbi:MAG: pseudouridine synthase [Myxococcota bacterium]